METLYTDLLQQPLTQTSTERVDIGDCKSVHEYIKTCLNAHLEPRSWAAFLIGKLEAIVWICASLALGHYGNGEDDTIHILQHHPAIYRPALAVAGLLATLNATIFLYVQVYLRMVQGIRKDPELAAPWAVPSAGCTGILCACSLVYACWGVWSWFTPAVWLVHLLALVTVINEIPIGGLQQTKVD